ncbi:speckle-type POZ protein [Caerostris extrusa]|uniref:Speckle-type POZ protein n=1 Tax=Caerostris extrusa TaxID=172846 RepID=A0AAV4QPE4_CAEEX|nr:speckle-type POZ protein [Caerostris extrusa]
MLMPFTYTWAIENASVLPLSNRIFSPAFTISFLKKTKWYLELETSTMGQSIACILHRSGTDNGPETITVCFHLFLRNDTEHIHNIRQGISSFLKFSCFRTERFLTFDDIQNSPSVIVPQDVLTVVCQMYGLEATTEYELDLCYARSRMSVERHSFEWSIRRFSCISPAEERCYPLKKLTTAAWCFFGFLFE